MIRLSPPFHLFVSFIAIESNALTRDLAQRSQQQSKPYRIRWIVAFVISTAFVISRIQRRTVLSLLRCSVFFTYYFLFVFAFSFFG